MDQGIGEATVERRTGEIHIRESRRSSFLHKTQNLSLTFKVYLHFERKQEFSVLLLVDKKANPTFTDTHRGRSTKEPSFEDFSSQRRTK